MKRALFAAAACLLASPLKAQEFSTATMRSLGLGEAYRLAVVRSEALAQQAEGIKQLEAAERLITASFRPALAFDASQYKQQNSPSQTKGYLTGSYALFSGMRDYIAAKAAASRTGAAKLDLERARQQLYLNTAQAYLDLYSAQREALIRKDQMNVTARRIAELQARADIGRSRTSEVVAAKTQLAQDKANYLGAAASERLAQQTLLFITGLDSDIAPQEISLSRETDLQEYLKLALLRPDLAAGRKSLETYNYLADIQDHNLWPSVNLAADYYAVRHPMPAPSDRWDGAVTLSVPLYTGGYSAAQKASAYAARRNAELALQLAERQALTEVRSAYDEHKYSILQEASLRDALALASDNSRYQQEDYKLGLVTNLDVLNALNNVLQTRLALSQAEVQRNWTLIKLDTAAGLDMKQ
jgi:outer membrane protein